MAPRTWVLSEVTDKQSRFALRSATARPAGAGPRRMDREMLRDVPLDEILAFRHSVGRNWRSSEYARRRPFVRHLIHGLG